MPRRSMTGRKLSDIFFFYPFVLFIILFFLSLLLFPLFQSVSDKQWTRSFPKFQWNYVRPVLVTLRFSLFFFSSTNCTPLNTFVISLHVYLTVNAYKVAKCGCLRTRKYFIYLVYLLFDDVVLLLIERCACHRMPRRN